MIELLVTFFFLLQIVAQSDSFVVPSPHSNQKFFAWLCWSFIWQFFITYTYTHSLYLLYQISVFTYMFPHTFFSTNESMYLYIPFQHIHSPTHSVHGAPTGRGVPGSYTAALPLKSKCIVSVLKGIWESWPEPREAGDSVMVTTLLFSPNIVLYNVLSSSWKAITVHYMPIDACKNNRGQDTLCQFSLWSFT